MKKIEDRIRAVARKKVVVRITTRVRAKSFKVEYPGGFEYAATKRAASSLLLAKARCIEPLTFKITPLP
jgi:hypothetical protein